MRFLLPVGVVFVGLWVVWGLLSAVLFVILVAEFVNGWTDAPNAIATVVATRVLRPRQAVCIAAILNIAGTFSGTAVAVSIGTGIVDPSIIDLYTVAGAMTGIVVWSYMAWCRGIPTSESHALIAGLAGAALAAAGPEVLLWAGWKKVLIGLGISSIGGLSFGLILFKIVKRYCSDWSPYRSRKVFGWLQLCSAGFMAFSHGSNDGQKFIGVFSLALLLGGVYATFIVPWWVIFLCAGVMGVGTMLGGYRIIQRMTTMGSLHEPYTGFAAEMGAATAIEIVSHLGIPVSTTHTINTAIMGVGVARRYTAVRWNIVQEMLLAWIVTFPICAAIAFVFTYALRIIVGH